MSSLSKKGFIKLLFKPQIKISKLRSFISWRLSNYYVVYLFISIPILIALCFLTAPFQVSDEPAHYLRAIGISHGQYSPVVSAEKTSAGGIVETGALQLTQRYSIRVNTDWRYRFHVSDLIRFDRDHKSRAPAFASYSNTAIYFPIAHIVPAVAIDISRFFPTTPLEWLYIGRLANVAVVLAVSAVAICLLEESGLFGVVFSLLPMVIFEEASTSADALVIPFSLLLVALIIRIINRKKFGVRGCALLFVAMMYVCVAKIAYIPLCVLPLAIAVLQRRRFRDLAIFSAIATVTLAIWAAWTFSVRDKVFNIRADRSDVDFNSQLAFLIHSPIQAAKTIIRSALFNAPMSVRDMVGYKLGWLDWNIPDIITFTFLSLLIVAVLARPIPRRAGWGVRLVVASGAGLCVILSHVLLYLQFSPVRASYVYGFQGRYLIPLLGFILVLMPNVSQMKRFNSVISVAVMFVAAAGSVATLVAVWARYWHV